MDQDQPRQDYFTHKVIFTRTKTLGVVVYANKSYFACGLQLDLIHVITCTPFILKLSAQVPTIY